MNPRRADTDERMQVLLVEDNLVDAHIITAILESEGRYKVTIAQDGVRGSQLVEDRSWDLVITDLNLPGENGLEVIRRSREHHPATPLLTTTGYTTPEYRQSALRNGADDVLVKPVDKDALLRKILHLMGTRPLERPALARTVMAIGAHPADIEVGCGGILLGHRDHEQEVVMLILTGGTDEEGSQARDAHVAAERLGASLFIHDPHATTITDTPEISEEIERYIQQNTPDTVYAPSIHDVNQNRINTHRAALVGSSRVPNLYCYQSATATTDFRPTLFVGIEDALAPKIELVGAFEGLRQSHPALSPAMLRSTAQYWGRFDGTPEVEPLEVVRSEI